VKSIGSVAFITFGGSPGEDDPKYRNIQEARERLQAQARESKDFEGIFALDWSTLLAMAREWNVSVPTQVHRYSFTPIILKLISLGAFGNFDYYLYAGAGCEINTNPMAKKDLAQMIKISAERGIYVENTLLPERLYTKKEVLRECNTSNEDANSPQIMATFFMVCKKFQPSIIANVAEEWLQLASYSNGILIADDFMGSIQDSFFKAHRNDQSLFSITLKKYKVLPVHEKQRSFERFFPSIRGSRTYLWTVRNRTGETALPKSIERRMNAVLLFPLEKVLDSIHSYRTLHRWKHNSRY
jgi:hypothetical protein